MSDPGAGDGDGADSGSADDRGAPRPNAGSPGDSSRTDGRTTGTSTDGRTTETTRDTRTRQAADSGPETPGEWVRWFFRTDHGAVVYLREVVSSVALVLLVGLLLFAVSGLWPPMVAVESGSMNPHMQRGDLVFVMEEHRLAPKAAYDETGVVTYQTGQRVGYTKFQLAGDVIVYQPDGNSRTTPIIHRARFWVNESENWVANGKANPEYLGAAESCGQLSQCPARHAGFITKGDANSRYDQVSGLSEPVKPAWVVGTAEFRIPWLGNIRLWAGQTDIRLLAGQTAGTPGVVDASRATDGRPAPATSPPSTADASPAASRPDTAGQCAWS